MPLRVDQSIQDHCIQFSPNTKAGPCESDRYHELDGLRAIACILVVIHHTFTSAASSAISQFSLSASRLLFFITASGVECFFCLSGFILVYPYVVGGKPLRLVPYAASRLRRIYPPFIFAWLLAGCVQYIVTSYPTWYSRPLQEFTLTTWLSQLNILTLLACTTLYNGAWWSLAIECVWYAIVPAVVWACRRHSIFRLSVVWMIITAATLPLPIVVHSWAPAAPIALNGVTQAVAGFLSFATCFAGAIWLLVCCSGIVGLLVSSGLGFAIILYCGFAGSFELVHSGFGLVWASVIGLCMRTARLRSLTSAPGLVWLGDRSYSLFLTHCTVFVLTNWAVSHWCPGRTVTYGIATRVIGLPLALIVAIILFWYVERRFSHRLTTANDFWPPISRVGL